jgi:hypothetical protein
MPKFWNQSRQPQVVYLPSTVADNTRYLIDADLAITVNDEHDVESMRRLCGDGRPFVEVPDDSPHRDYRSLRVSHKSPTGPPAEQDVVVVIDTSRRR